MQKSPRACPRAASIADPQIVHLSSKMMSLSSFREGSQGASALAWSEKSQSWLCGDSEGSVFSKTTDAADHTSVSLDCDAITSIAVHPEKDECVVAQGDSLCVRSLTSMDSVIQDGLLKSNLAFTHIQFDHTGKYLFAASMEPDVAILSMDHNGSVEQKITTGNLGVRTFALSADSKHIAVVDIDGSVCVHSLAYSTDVSGARRIAEKTMETFNNNIVAKEVTRSGHEMGCKASWYPLTAEKVLLAVPSTSGSIVLLAPAAQKTSGERAWVESFLLPAGDGPSHHAHALNIAEFSPNGSFLATADVTGAIVLWAFDASRPSDSTAVLSLTSIVSPLHDLVWGRNAVDNYLVATTVNDWYQFPTVLPGNALPALMPGQAATTSLTGVSASDYLVGSAADVDADAMDEESALIAAAMAAEAAYTQTQTQTQTQSHTQPQVAPATAASPVAKKATVSVASPKQAQPAKKRLTKVNTTAVQDEDDMLFEDEGSRPAATKPATAATDADADVVADATSIAAIKHKAGVSVSSNKRLIADDALDMDDDDDDDNDLDDEDNSIDNDVEAGKMSLADMLKMAKNGAVVGGISAPARKLQAPFQPSSTKFDEKRRRYLVWNKVGSIVLREETVENRIEIRFNNTGGSNRNESFPDRTGFTMGALSYEGAVFASDPEPADDAPGANRDPELRKETPGSTIYYHAFAGQKHMAGANESFSWTLSDGEAALAVAVGMGWVAVASSRNLLYIFNAAGMPCMTMALAGPVLTLTGCDMLLGVVYHGYTTQADLYEIVFQAGCRVRKVVSGVTMPLSKQATTEAGDAGYGVATEQRLEWVGFDVDHHVLTALDGQGMLWGLLNCADWQWVPLLDIHQVRKSIEHTYWPTCVRNYKLVYVLLNGESRPAIFPQPVVASRALRVPVPHMRDGKDVGEVQKERMHMVLWANAMTNHLEAALADATEASVAGKIVPEDPASIDEKYQKLLYEADKAVLTALQDACQRQRTPLALSLALQIRTEKTLMAAITIANHFGRTAVAEALDAILESKQALAAQLEQMATTQEVYSSSEYAPEEENMFTDHAPTFDESSPPRAERRVNFAAPEPTAGTLSSKVTSKPPVPLFGASKTSQVVSPAVSSSGSAEKPANPARNPFAVVSSGSTPQKRKNVFDGIQEMKASPSPKKPTLNRQSSFSQQARQQSLTSKRIL